MTPKEAGFTMPAEWHAHTCCWMAWPTHEQTWAKVGLLKARIAYANVANAIAHFEPVIMLVNKEEQEGAAELCGEKIRLLPLSINDSWTRDTQCVGGQLRRLCVG